MRFGETPVPIPNTTVKTKAADGTMLETVWESRRPPENLSNAAANSPQPRGRSSVGRAPALQAGGREFESLRLHQGALTAKATQSVQKTGHRSGGL
jgi:hypothetical protein